jgi:hypothetical protein
LRDTQREKEREEWRGRKGYSKPVEMKIRFLGRRGEIQNIYIYTFLK